MSEKEKAIFEKLGQSIKNATDEQKQYLLGLADGMALMTENKHEDDKE